MTRDEVVQIIIEFLEENGSKVGSQKVRDLTLVEMTDENLSALIIPSTIPSTGEWVQTTLKTMMRPITNNITDLTTIKNQVVAACDAAYTAAASIDQAVVEASNVNATLVGMTVTITDKNGDSRSVNIGFEIDPNHVYSSKAAMIADADNVQAGQFCMIATTDPTATDNATLWSRNQQPASAGANAYTFLSDLDQAATHVWDDWNTNLRGQVVQATSDANDAATLANTKAGIAQTAADNADAKATAANTAANNANNIYNTVNTWYNGSNNNGFKNTAETWLSSTQTAWNNWFSDSLTNGVRKLWNTFWSSINTSWNGFFGTSADDANGVRKIWSTWYSATQSAWSSWFGTSASTGVQKQWADLKADAQSDHTRAGTDHTRAGTDHTTAASDHTTASSDHTASTTATSSANTAATNANNKATYANTEADRAKNLNDHPAYIGNDNYWYIWNYSTQAYVKSSYAKGDNLDWDSMTEAEKQALADEVLSHIAFDDAPVQNSTNAVKSGGLYTEFGKKQDKLTFAVSATCQAIVNELT